MTTRPDHREIQERVAVKEGPRRGLLTFLLRDALPILIMIIFLIACTVLLSEKIEQAKLSRAVGVLAEKNTHP
ncbi:MAG: hypothetical protein RBT64_09485 [Trichloromonas sp.]|jgi:hypothetical protein|nr:hypothetical protein [Trichloromonas sp.]